MRKPVKKKLCICYWDTKKQKKQKGKSIIIGYKPQYDRIQLEQGGTKTIYQTGSSKKGTKKQIKKIFNFIFFYLSIISKKIANFLF